MHIGLVGGIGPAATDYYYRGLVAAARERDFDLNLTIVHADSSTLIRNQVAGNESEQVEIFRGLTSRLQAAGAEIVAITAISGHFCIDAFEEVSALPVCNMIRSVNRFVERAEYKRLGILGTRVAMETRLYGGITSAQVIPPTGAELIEVDRAYLEMASAGSATESQRDIMFSASRSLVASQNAEAVLLAGTDLVLAIDESDADFKVVDCAAVHIDELSGLAAKLNHPQPGGTGE